MKPRINIHSFCEKKRIYTRTLVAFAQVQTHMHIHICISKQGFQAFYFTSVKQTSRNCETKQLRVIFETDCLVRATKIHAELAIVVASLVNKLARGIQVDSRMKLPVRSYTRRRNFTETYSHLEKQREDRERTREKLGGWAK